MLKTNISIKQGKLMKSWTKIILYQSFLVDRIINWKISGLTINCQESFNIISLMQLKNIVSMKALSIHKKVQPNNN